MSKLFYDITITGEMMRSHVAITTDSHPRDEVMIETGYLNGHGQIVRQRMDGEFGDVVDDVCGFCVENCCVVTYEDGFEQRIHRGWMDLDPNHEFLEMARTNDP